MKDLMQQTIEAIAEYEDALVKLAGMNLVAGYLVRCQNVCLSFDMSPDGYVFNPRPCPPHKARSFTWEQAKTVASKVRNGNAVRGEAVHVIQAVTEALDAQKAVMATLVAFSAGVDLSDDAQ